LPPHKLPKKLHIGTFEEDDATSYNTILIPKDEWKIKDPPDVLEKASMTGVYQKWFTHDFPAGVAIEKKKKANQRTLTDAQVTTAQNWVKTFDGHEKWKVLQQGPEPTVPDPIPQDVVTLAASGSGKNKQGNPIRSGNPPAKTYEKPTKYEVTAPDGTKFIYEDHVHTTDGLYVEFDDGVGNSGKTGGASKIESVYNNSGVQASSPQTVKKVFTVLSDLEGKFDAINTYDTGYVSAGFIQFISKSDGQGPLAAVLRDMKAKAPAEFKTYFQDLGIDVDNAGISVVDQDSTTDALLHGNAAVTKIRTDKRYTAKFQYAGAKSAEYQYAQARIAYKQYYFPDMNFSLDLDVPDPPPPKKTKKVTVTGKYRDVLKSEAGKVASVDRCVQRGEPNARKTFHDACQEVVIANALTNPTVEDLAQHQLDIVKKMKNRKDVLSDSTLSQP
jgi:hypothetical protein